MIQGRNITISRAAGIAGLVNFTPQHNQFVVFHDYFAGPQRITGVSKEKVRSLRFPNFLSRATSPIFDKLKCKHSLKPQPCLYFLKFL